MASLIKQKQSTRYPNLTVHKYQNKVFYKNLWHTDPQLLESRGHAYDSTGKLVINPPTKVFNYQENNTFIDSEELCLYIHKINGFLACLTYNEDLDEVLVSSTGSLDSVHCDMARDYLDYAISQIKTLKTSNTFFFEVCHHNDPHIIKENIGAYLLGCRSLHNKSSYTTSSEDQKNLDFYAKIFRVSRPYYGYSTMAELLEDVKTIEHEGYMVYGLQSNTVLKLKSPYYLSLKAMARKKNLLSLSRKRLDEEFYPLLDHLLKLGSTFIDLPEQEKLAYIRNYYHYKL